MISLDGDFDAGIYDFPLFDERIVTSVDEKTHEYSKGVMKWYREMGAGTKVEFEVKFEYDGKETKTTASGSARVEDRHGNHAEIKVEKDTEGKTTTTVRSGAEASERDTDKSNKK